MQYYMLLTQPLMCCIDRLNLQSEADSAAVSNDYELQ